MQTFVVILVCAEYGDRLIDEQKEREGREGVRQAGNCPGASELRHEMGLGVWSSHLEHEVTNVETKFTHSERQRRG